MTASGGAAAEVPRLYRFIAQRTGRSTDDVRGALRRRAPRTSALLNALPLTAVADELPDLTRYLRRALRPGRGDLDATLRRRAPALAQVLPALPPATAQWDAIPSTGRMTALRRADPGAHGAAVRRLPAPGPPAACSTTSARTSRRSRTSGRRSTRSRRCMLILGLAVMLYGGLMMQFVSRRY